MKKGIVKWFNLRKGFGFITGEDGEDIFIHYTGIKKEGFRAIYPDQHVVYDTTTDEKGRTIACNVEVVQE